MSDEHSPTESSSSSATRYLVSEEVFAEGAAEWINEDDEEEHDDMPHEGEGGVNGAGFAGDPSTLSRPDFWRVTNIDFDLTADFGKKILHGSVDLDVEKQTSEEQNLVGILWLLWICLFLLWSIDWLVRDSPLDWLIDWLTDWSIDWLIDWLVSIFLYLRLTFYCCRFWIPVISSWKTLK